MERFARTEEYGGIRLFKARSGAEHALVQSPPPGLEERPDANEKRWALNTEVRRAPGASAGAHCVCGCVRRSQQGSRVGGVDSAGSGEADCSSVGDGKSVVWGRESVLDGRLTVLFVLMQEVDDGADNDSDEDLS